MKAHIGEEGTEQFSVTVSISRWDHFLAIFKRRQIRVQVFVSASEGAQRAIMTLDPEQLARDTEEILHEIKLARESSRRILAMLEKGRSGIILPRLTV